MSHLPEGDIAPGASAEVAVSTKATASRQGVFRHTATLLTNDPDRQVVTLTIRGTYRTFLAAVPELLVFRRAPQQHERLRAELEVYSQVFDRFELADMHSSLEGTSWEVEALGAPSLENLTARSGYRIALLLPEDLPEEAFSHSLHLTAVAGSEHKPRSLAIPLRGAPVRRVQVFGPGLALGRLLRLGTIPQGTGKRMSLTLKVVDEHRKLDVENIAVQPAFVRVNVSPFNEDAQKLGLYRIDVEVPSSTPMCNYMGGRAGSVRIETDHPKVPELIFELEFAVTGS
jgi:hypothetical protein